MHATHHAHPPAADKPSACVKAQIDAEHLQAELATTQLMLTEARAQIALLQQSTQHLYLALEFAAEQLEGWVKWKCPARHRHEHETAIRRLLDVLEGQAWEPPT